MPDKQMKTGKSFLVRHRTMLLCLTMILAVSVFFWKWFIDNRNPEKATHSVAKIPVVSVISRTLFRQDQLPAEIQAYQDVMIYPKIPGFVKWIGVDRGSVVKKGQLMVTMYAPEYLSSRNEALSKVASAKAALASGESKLQEAEAGLKKRQENLLGDESTYQRVKAASLVPGVIATNDVVQWGQTVEVDRQDINSQIKRVNAVDHEVSALQENLTAAQKSYDNFSDFASYLDIPAPFNGYITERNMHVGSFVGTLGSGAYPAICRIQQLDLLRIVSPIPERDTAGILLGSKVEFSVSTFPGRKFVGTVARISNCLDKATRTMPVELNFFNPDYKILPGMFCEVFWPTRRHEASLFVPVTSVITTPLDTFVCKVVDDTVEWVSVKKGQIMDGMVEVFGDLHEGDVVARTASEELQNGTPVVPIAIRSREEIESMPKKRKPYYYNAY